MKLASAWVGSGGVGLLTELKVCKEGRSGGDSRDEGEGGRMKGESSYRAVVECDMLVSSGGGLSWESSAFVEDMKLK